MQLDEVTIPRAEAREAAADYRRQARLEQDAVARRELEEMARAYRIAANEELALIALTPTLERGGTVVRTRVTNGWRERKLVELRTNYLVPRLAVAPADAQFVFTLGVQQDGSIQYVDRLRPHWRYTSGVRSFATGFHLPDGFQAGSEIDPYKSAAWAAQVPIVPPKHRPRNGHANLRNYLTLWECDSWTWMRDPAPSRDPALLRHVAGDIYAVLATWDLTELERLVLAGRRLPT